MGKQPLAEIEKLSFWHFEPNTILLSELLVDHQNHSLKTSGVLAECQKVFHAWRLWGWRLSSAALPSRTCGDDDARRWALGGDGPGQVRVFWRLQLQMERAERLQGGGQTKKTKHESFTLVPTSGIVIWKLECAKCSKGWSGNVQAQANKPKRTILFEKKGAENRGVNKAGLFVSSEKQMCRHKFTNCF